MNEKCKWGLLAAALAVLLLFGACSAQRTKEMSTMPSAAGPAGGSAESGGAHYATTADYGEPEVLRKYDYEEISPFIAALQINSAEEARPPEDRKIIQNAWLDVEAGDAAGLYEQIAVYGRSLGGYEFSYSITNHETYSVIDAVFKIPPEKLNAFIKFAGENGKIINSTMNSEDITESYFDMQTRLETKRKALQRYYELLQRATTIEEIVYIQNTIDRLTEEIESYEGRLKLWNSQVEMATATLRIRQENDPLSIRKEIRWDTLSFDDMGYLIKSGLAGLLTALASVFQWLLIAVAVCSPLLVVAGAVLWILRLKKKQKARAQGADKENKETQNERNNE